MKKTLRKLLPGSVRTALGSYGNVVSTRDVEPVLDVEFYCENNPDVALSGIDPRHHFCRHGVLEGRLPSAFFSPDYVAAVLNKDALDMQTLALSYARSGLARKPRLIFVSHDASRTGAPAIILRLLDMFSKSDLFECFTLLDQGGERLHEFEALSHTYVMSRSRHEQRWSNQSAHHEVAKLFQPHGMFQNNAPVCALVNSAESYGIGRALAQLGVPVVSLIHEIAAYYPPMVFEDIANYSEKMVFPSHFVSCAAAQHCDLDMSKTIVRGQGLLEDDFGALDTSICRRSLREDLAIEEDAFIVLNVGTMDIRKGADLFVNIAKLFFEQATPDRPVYFVWYGAPDETFLYAQEFVQRHELQDKVRLMPSTSEIEKVFLGGDIFLLSARADPFPCVIHEAMACGLPVVAFRNGGGAPELIGDDCGSMIGIGDLQAAAMTIRSYVDTPEKLAEQGNRAKHKIMQDWDYYSYFQDIYQTIQDCATAPPKTGWQPVAAQKAVDHLVIMRGHMDDVELLCSLGLDKPDSDCLVVLIDGCFGVDSEEVTANLRALGTRYQVCQPTEDTQAARAIRLRGLLKNPKPKRLTLINSLELLSEEQLKPLVFAKDAVQSGDSLSAQQLYARVPYLNRLLLADQTLMAQLHQLNPNAVGVVEGLSQLSEPQQENGGEQP